jgi:hypothetical protein
MNVNVKVEKEEKKGRFDWFLLFILVNCIVLGGFIWQLRSKLDHYKVSDVELLGPKVGNAFVYPLGIREPIGDDKSNSFLQMIHPDSNTKVYVYHVVSNSAASKVAEDSDIEKIFSTIRTYTPGKKHSINEGIFNFLRGQFDYRRAETGSLVKVRGVSFLPVVVNDHDYYLMAVLRQKKGSLLSVVFFNPDQMVDAQVAENLFIEYPRLYNDWVQESQF